MEKIKLGISSCLLGNNVRYDGGHKRDYFLCDILGKHIEYVPVCPEAECGLGIPRESMRLEGDTISPRLVTCQSRLDKTDILASWAHERLRKLETECLHGFIFKSNSPSCGMERVKVYNQKGEPVKAGVGIFAWTFMKHFPVLPAEDENRLRDGRLRKNFLERILCLHNQF
jgi:uncharacterized protein YbbK (DUF523 family)